MDLAPGTRNANRWLLLALIVFCLGLCAACLLWMRARTVAEGGRVYPPPPGSPTPAQTSCQPLEINARVGAVS